MSKVRQAFAAVVPNWLAICVISLAWGLTMQMLPGFMEAAELYPTSWSANLAHYDPHSYLLIAEQGYGAAGRDWQSSVRYPLFPFFARLLTGMTGIDTYDSLFWLSKVALLIALIGLWLLVEHLHGAEQAGRAVLYMTFPLLGSGYVWLMSYPEALHLAQWAFGFFLLYKRQYALCGLITVLSVWTRPHAVAILPAFALVLVIEAVRQHGRRGFLDAELWRRGLLTCGLPLLAYTAWVLYISRLTLLPLSPFTGQQMYGRDMFVFPLVRVADLLRLLFRSPPYVYDWGTLIETYQVILILLALLALCAVAARKRLGWEVIVFSVLSIAPAVGTNIDSAGRYALLTWIPLAAIYVVPKRFDSALIAVGAALSFMILVGIALSKGLTP